MISNKRAQGYFYAIISAVFYGLNPLGAIYLSREGVDVPTILFYRNTLAIGMIAAMMALQKRSFRINLLQAGVLTILGLLFITSSITLYYSYMYIDAGVASTLLFIYPVMVAAIMALFFRERAGKKTIISILLSIAGVGLLCRSSGGNLISTVGVMLVMASSLSYALYIVVVNKFPQRPASITITFYVLIVCALASAAFSYMLPDSLPDAATLGNSTTGCPRYLFGKIQLLTTASAWGWVIMLSLLCSVIALLCMAKASKSIGPTPTAILGALEPVTGVVVGVVFFQEAFSLRFAAGILLILVSVLIIIARKNG